MKRRLDVLPAVPAKLSAARLFEQQFLPFYPPGASLESVRSADANPGNNPAILDAIEQTAQVFAALAPEALGAPDLVLDGSDASVHRLSAALTAAARERLFAARPKAGEPPLLVHFVLHAALYVGSCAVKGHGGRWLVRNPLWETRVRLDSPMGTSEIAPFAWLLRSLSDDGLEKITLADRYRAHVEVPFEDADAWPVIAPPERRLPRLARVRYDTLFQHLKAHLPELDDFGPDFPSPPRFAELGLTSLDLLLVGGGRALVLYGAGREIGPGKRGLHLFWMTRSGFSKSAYYEIDVGPEAYRVTAGRASNGVETVVVTLLTGGRTVEHEVLWWGP